MQQAIVADGGNSQLTALPGRGDGWLGRGVRWLFAGVAALGLVPVCGAQGGGPALVAAHAELLRSIDSSKLGEGSVFFLRTTAAWALHGCSLPVETTIEGQVAEIHRRKQGAARNEMVVRFAPVLCAGSETEKMLPLLIAMRGPERPQQTGMEAMEQHAAQESAAVALLHPSAPGASVGPGLENTAENAGKASTELRQYGAGDAQDGDDLKTGEVRDIRGVRMDLPSGSETTTLYSSRDIWLQSQTRFTLAFVRESQMLRSAAEAGDASQSVSKTVAATTGSDRVANATGTVAHAALPVETEEPEVCAAGGCAQLSTTSADVTGKAQWVVSLEKLGYAPRLGATIRALDGEAAVHFVGEDQLLVTFNPHGLVRRTPAQVTAGVAAHNERAVLLARSDGRVLKVLDWTVQADGGPYVWGLGDGRVLAQVGDELVIYGGSMVAQPQRFALPGPLVFVSVTPGAGPILLATVHEKHTKAEHARLQAFLGPGMPINEDYDLTALDRNLKETGTRLLTAEPVAPALLPAAMVTAEPERHAGWLVQAQSWSGPRRTLSKFRSGCPVDVDALAGQLIVAEGCAPAKVEERWYRVLNGQGATLLKTTPPSADLVQQVESDADGGMLAIATTHFERAVDLAAGMTAGQFARMSVEVYSTATGRKRFGVELPDGSDLEGTFALSPTGQGLAVLTDGGLRLYGMDGVGGSGAAAR